MTATFKEANRVRLELKMKISNYHWYKSSEVMPEDDGYAVIVIVSQVSNAVRKIINPIIDGVSIKVEHR